MLKEISSARGVMAFDAAPAIFRAPLDNDRRIRLSWEDRAGENIQIPCMTLRRCEKNGYGLQCGICHGRHELLSCGAGEYCLENEG